MGESKVVGGREEGKRGGVGGELEREWGRGNSMVGRGVGEGDALTEEERARERETLRGGKGESRRGRERGTPRD
jgi:hypothetical protein